MTNQDNSREEGQENLEEKIGLFGKFRGRGKKKKAIVDVSFMSLPGHKINLNEGGGVDINSEEGKGVSLKIHKERGKTSINPTDDPNIAHVNSDRETIFESSFPGMDVFVGKGGNRFKPIDDRNISFNLLDRMFLNFGGNMKNYFLARPTSRKGINYIINGVIGVVEAIIPRGGGLLTKYGEKDTKLVPVSESGTSVEVGKEVKVVVPKDRGLLTKYSEKDTKLVPVSEPGTSVEVGRKVKVVTPKRKNLSAKFGGDGTDTISPTDNSVPVVNAGREFEARTLEEEILSVELGRNWAIFRPKGKGDDNPSVTLHDKIEVTPLKSRGIIWNVIKKGRSAVVTAEPIKKGGKFLRMPNGILNLNNFKYKLSDGGIFDFNKEKWKKRWVKGLSLMVLGSALAGGVLKYQYLMNNNEGSSPQQPRSKRFDSIPELVEANGIYIYHKGAFDRWTDVWYDINTSQGLCEKDTYVTDRVKSRHLLVRLDGRVPRIVNTNGNNQKEKKNRGRMVVSREILMNYDLRIGHGGDFVLPIRKGEQGYPFALYCNGSKMGKAVERYLSGTIPPNQWWKGAGLKNKELKYGSAFEGIFKDFKDNEGNPTLPQELTHLLKAQALVESRFIPESISPSGARGILQLLRGTLSHYGVKRENDFKIPYQIRCAYAHYEDKIKEFKRSLGDIRASDEDKAKLALYLAMQAYHSGEGNVSGILKKPESKGILEKLLSENRSPQEVVHGLIISNYGFGKISNRKIGEESINYLPKIFAAERFLSENELRK